jgi:hypothetical protein
MTSKHAAAVVASLLFVTAAACNGESPPTTPASVAPTVTAATPKPSARPTAKPTAKPSAKPSARPSGAATPKPGASAKPSATPSEKPADDALALLDEVKSQSLGGSMKATITSYEMKIDKSKSTSGTFNLQVQDTSYRLDCIKHSKPNNVGSKTVLVYGQDSARVKPAGLLSVVTVTLKLSDSNLISLNGITLDKILSHGVLERVTGGGYTAEVAGKTKIGDDNITLIKLKPESGTHPLSDSADFEYVGFDDNKLYRMWAMYAKPELGLPQNNLLYQVTVDTAEPNVTISPDAFKL